MFVDESKDTWSCVVDVAHVQAAEMCQMTDGVHLKDRIGNLTLEVLSVWLCVVMISGSTCDDVKWNRYGA